MPLATLHEPAPTCGKTLVLTPEGFAARLASHRSVFLTLAAAVLGRRGDAEDALQDASAIALGKLDSFQDGTNFSAWMGQIVRYVALNHARRRSGRTVLPQERLEELWSDAPIATEPLDPTRLCELSREQDHFDDELVAALATLTPVARACLLLRAVQDLDYSEISRLLGIPEGTAMSHVHRARAALRSTLVSRNDRGELT
jgi:RNA polymerase sigma-70 factor (ECF subfamily)